MAPIFKLLPSILIFLFYFPALSFFLSQATDNAGQRMMAASADNNGDRGRVGVELEGGVAGGKKPHGSLVGRSALEAKTRQVPKGGVGG